MGLKFPNLLKCAYTAVNGALLAGYSRMRLAIIFLICILPSYSFAAKRAPLRDASEIIKFPGSDLIFANQHDQMNQTNFVVRIQNHLFFLKYSGGDYGYTVTRVDNVDVLGPANVLYRSTPLEGRSDSPNLFERLSAAADENKILHEAAFWNDLSLNRERYGDAKIDVPNSLRYSMATLLKVTGLGFGPLIAIPVMFYYFSPIDLIHSIAFIGLVGLFTSKPTYNFLLKVRNSIRRSQNDSTLITHRWSLIYGLGAVSANQTLIGTCMTVMKYLPP